MQPAANVIEGNTKRGECPRLKVDVFERDRASPYEGEQLVALPANPGITHRTACVVPDDEAAFRHDILDGRGALRGSARARLEKVITEKLSQLRWRGSVRAPYRAFFLARRTAHSAATR